MLNLLRITVSITFAEQHCRADGAKEDRVIGSQTLVARGDEEAACRQASRVSQMLQVKRGGPDLTFPYVFCGSS